MPQSRQAAPAEFDIMEVIGRTLHLDSKKLVDETQLEEHDRDRGCELALLLNEEFGSRITMTHVRRWKKLSDIVRSVKNTCAPPKPRRRSRKKR